MLALPHVAELKPVQQPQTQLGNLILDQEITAHTLSMTYVHPVLLILLMDTAIQLQLVVQVHTLEVLQEPLVLIFLAIVALAVEHITPAQVSVKEQLLPQIPVLAVQLVGPLSLLVAHTTPPAHLYTAVQMVLVLILQQITAILIHMALR
jgi:hypothetical protein